MGKFIDGLYYRNDQLEPDGKGGWRVKGAGAGPLFAFQEGESPEAADVVVSVLGDGGETEAEAAGAETEPATQAEVVPGAEPATEAKDEDLSVPGPTPPSTYETKVIAAKPKPGTGKRGGYDTKD